MNIEDLNIRQRELYDCQCPEDRPCSPEMCAPYRAYYDALFAGKSEEESQAAAAAVTVPIPPSINGHAMPAKPRKPDGCRSLGQWQGKTCDEKT